MPTVPRYQTRVNEFATPSVRMSAPNDIEAFGGGSTQQVVNNAVSYFEDENQKADDVITTGAFSKLVQLKNDLIYNPESGLQTKKGENALKAQDDFREKFKKGIDELESGLHNDTQRYIFKKMSLDQESQFDSSIQKHVYAETIELDNQNTRTALNESLNDAVLNYANPGTIQKNIQIQTALIKANGERNGESSDVIKEKINASVSQTHMAVIDRMLNNDQDMLAKQYFEQIKKQITGQDIASVEKSLQTGTLRGESQRQTEKIMAKVSTLTEARSEARKIENPELQDMIISRLESRFKELNDLEQQDKDNMFFNAFEMMKENKGASPIDIIPPSVYSKLGTQERLVLERINDPGTDDVNQWVDFINKSPDEISKLNKSEFYAYYWSGMTEAHRKQAVDIWNSAKQDSSSEPVNGFFTIKERIKNTLIDNGLYEDGTKKDNLKNNLHKMESVIDQRFQEFERINKRKPDAVEQQKIIDDELIKKVFVRRLFKDPVKPISTLSESELKKAYVDLKDIPDDFIKQVSDRTRALNATYSEEKLKKLYVLYLAGRNKDYEDLIIK